MELMDTKPSQSLSKGGRPFMVSSGDALETALSPGKPGNWASDHRAESNRFVGWHYVAIRSKCEAAQMCEVDAYTWDVSSMGSRPDSRKKGKYATEADKGQPFDRDHSLMRLLRQPNPAQSGGSFRYEQALQLCLTGSCLVWNVPNVFGKVVRRYVIPTATAQPCQPNDEYPYGYWKITPEGDRYGLTYSWYLSNMHTGSLLHCVDVRQMQVIRWPHPIFKDDGYSPVSATAGWTDSSDQIEVSRANQFRNGFKPSAIVTMEEFEGTQEELDAVLARLNAKYATADNNGKLMAIAGKGTGVEILDTNPHEMDYMQSSQEVRDSILASHGVPGAAVGLVSPTGREGVYAPLLQAAKNVEPMLSLLAEEDNEQWVWQYGKGAYVDYTPRRVDDPEQDRADMNMLISGKSITKGELRLRMGMELFGDDRDDEIAGSDMAAMEAMSGGVAGIQNQQGTSTPAGSELQNDDESEETLSEIARSVVKAVFDRLENVTRPKSIAGMSTTAGADGGFVVKADNPKGCVMAMTPESVNQELKRMQGILDPEIIIDTPGDFHVTVLYGLIDSSPEIVSKHVESLGLVNVTVGRCSLFTKPEADVIKLDVDGDDLRALNKKLAELPHQNDYDEYLPHITLAYVKPGSGKDYLDRLNQLNGQQIQLARYVFSDGMGNQTEL